MITIEDLKINIDNCVKYIKDKYGEQEDLSPAQWLTLIAEEFGEFAQEINDNNLGNNFIEEGCQVCATTLCAMEQIFNNSTKVMDKKFVIKKNDKKYVVYATDAETAKQKLEVKINPDRIVEVADDFKPGNLQQVKEATIFLENGVAELRKYSNSNKGLTECYDIISELKQRLEYLLNRMK